MTISILLLLGGVLLAWLGGELFVRGSVGLASWARWPTAVIGATVAAFGTSAPELFVAIHSARDGVPQLSFGDVLGSNVVNIALVLAIALLIAPMKAARGDVLRDYTIALLVPPLVGVLALDGHISRFDGGLMLAVFAGWLALAVSDARRHSGADTSSGEAVKPGRSVLVTLAGLGVLMIAAQFVVHGGKGIAVALGWSTFVIGAVVVALATSTPELATTIISKLKGHDEMGLGNILGSNIFNALFIAAVVALIQPFDMPFVAVRTALIGGLLSTLLIWPGKAGLIGRGRGVVLLLLYAAFVWISMGEAGGTSH